jgi:hypothetical protein
MSWGKSVTTGWDEKSEKFEYYYLELAALHRESSDAWSGNEDVWVKIWCLASTEIVAQVCHSLGHFHYLEERARRASHKGLAKLMVKESLCMKGKKQNYCHQEKFGWSLQ